MKMEEPENVHTPVTRRALKRKILSLQTLLRAKDIPAENRKSVERSILELRKQILSLQGKFNREELQKRREFLEKNPGLKDIFQTLWTVFSKYSNDGFLTKEGYLKYNHAILVALAGVKAFEDVSSTLESDWNYDKSAFGPFDRQGFFDLVFETIETWAEVMNPNCYAAFAWALLDSVAETKSNPPKLRPLREVRCITKLENEAVRSTVP
jgi:hypothetical protein